MNNEVSFLLGQLEDAYSGDPWYGRSVKALLDEADESIAFEKPSGQHSMVELLYHMILWREFVINRLGGLPDKDLAYFEVNDWQVLDHKDATLWKKGRQKLDETQKNLVEQLRKIHEAKLEEEVKDRKYNFRKLLHGFIQHDIYHAGQIAYIKKLLEKK